MMCTCNVCFIEVGIENIIRTGCSFNICRVCLREWFHLGHIKCPACQSDILEYYALISNCARVHLPWWQRFKLYITQLMYCLNPFPSE
jgi:hypothetical protein